MRKNYEFAETVVCAEYRESYIRELCKDYETDQKEEFQIIVAPEDVAKEKNGSSDFPYGYLESLAFYRKFCEKVLEKNILLFHASVVAVDGEAYLFTAPSGTGKSTHTALWRKVFQEKAVMINDDKPLLRFLDDGIWVYGTPWDGKHRLSTNTKAKVKAICMLGRGETNTIQRTDFVSAYPVILNQTYRPDYESGMQKTLELVNDMLGQVPVYSMKCNVSEEAAQMAYEAMRG